MTFGSCLQKATAKLEKAGIGTARLDTLVLLEDVTGQDRAWLLANPDAEVSTAEKAELEKLLKLRANHIPLAYVRGRTEFYAREFVINQNVLEPRPESETMIDMLKSIKDLGSEPLIADVGTGSGALGITAQLELPNSTVELIDIDEKALKTAKINVDKFTLPIRLLESDLLSTTTAMYDVLLCNLPYVPDDFKINTAAGHEPSLALYGGPDGLDLYRKLFLQLKNRSYKPLYILSEAFPMQHAELAKIASSVGYKQADKNDFVQLFICTQK